MSQQILIVTGGSLLELQHNVNAELLMLGDVCDVRVGKEAANLWFATIRYIK